MQLELPLVAKHHRRDRRERLRVRSDLIERVGARRNRVLDVGVSEPTRVDQLLVVNDPDRDARPALGRHLILDPDLECAYLVRDFWMIDDRGRLSRNDRGREQDTGERLNGLTHLHPSPKKTPPEV